MPGNFLNHLQWYARAVHPSQAIAAEAVGTCSFNPQIYKMLPGESCLFNLGGRVLIRTYLATNTPWTMSQNLPSNK